MKTDAQKAWEVECALVSTKHLAWYLSVDGAKARAMCGTELAPQIWCFDSSPQLGFVRYSLRRAGGSLWLKDLCGLCAERVFEERQDSEPSVYLALYTRDF